MMRATLKQIENVAKDIKTFWFKPEKPIDYTAGQYVEVSLPHENADQRGQKHWFTLSSSPTEALIGITTKQTTELSSSFKRTLFNLSLGTNISISAAMGDFVLPKDPSIPLAFIAGGIGVTPMRSMLKWLADKHQQRDIRMIYGAKSLDQIAFHDLLRQHTAQLDIVLSEPPTKWSGLTGNITSGLVLECLSTSHDQTIFYISGPEPLVEKLQTNLLNAGIGQSKLVLDFFPGYPLH